MESLVFAEEWMLSNVLSSADLYDNELHIHTHYNDGDYSGSEKLSVKDSHLTLIDQNSDKYATTTTFSGWATDDSGVQHDFESWLEEATTLSGLDASLHDSSAQETKNVAQVLAELEAAAEACLDTPVGSFEEQANFLMQDPQFNFTEMVVIKPAEAASLPVTVTPNTVLSVDVQVPTSPIEMDSVVKPSFPVHNDVLVKYVQPSSIDVRGLTSRDQDLIVMNDLDILHIPEDSVVPDDVTQLLLEALSDPKLAQDLDLAEVETILSSPPSSPEALVPSCVPMEAPESPEQDSDDEYAPPAKRRATSTKGTLKHLKPSERKERKKAQNKNAATKYRHKKRHEEDGAKKELDEVESKNQNLKRKVEDLQSEIKYMKGILNEVLREKGLRIK